MREGTGGWGMGGRKGSRAERAGRERWSEQRERERERRARARGSQSTSNQSNWAAAVVT